MAGGHGEGRGLRFPRSVAVGVITKWSPDIHSKWPQEIQSLVNMMLLIDQRKSNQGLPSLGPLLLTHILPLALPLLMLAPMGRPGAGASTQRYNIEAVGSEAQPFFDEVQHTEPPAVIDQITAAALVAVQEAGFIERNLGTAVDFSGAASSDMPVQEIATHDEVWQSSSAFSPLLLMNFNRHPSAFEEALLGSEMLREVREALDRAGSSWRMLHGTKLFVRPAEVQAAMRATVGMNVGASHVIVSEALAAVVLAEVNALPRCHNVRLKEVRVLAYTSGGEAEGTVVVRNSFLQSPAQLLQPQQVVNSTTAARRVCNPRRHVSASV